MIRSSAETGIPPSDGKAAATFEQRRVIMTTLQQAGYKVSIPPWFNKDLTPNNQYWFKK